MVPIILLHPHKRNYRQHPPMQIQKIKASLERFGQVRSIVVQANEENSYTIIAGHGVYEAAQELGFNELRADILPSWWSSEQVSGYLVADNHLSADAVDDEAIFAELLQEQQNAGYDLASLGTDDVSLRQMLEALGNEYVNKNEDTSVSFKEYDETIADDLDTEMCGECGKLCLKSEGKK